VRGISLSSVLWLCSPRLRELSDSARVLELADDG